MEDIIESERPIIHFLYNSHGQNLFATAGYPQLQRIKELDDRCQDSITLLPEQIPQLRSYPILQLGQILQLKSIVCNYFR